MAFPVAIAAVSAVAGIAVGSTATFAISDTVKQAALISSAAFIAFKVFAPRGGG